MFFPWGKFEELPTGRRNTLQIFITNRRNLRCKGCFAKSVISRDNSDISLDEYVETISTFMDKDGKQINLLGGEPLLHPSLSDILEVIGHEKARAIHPLAKANGFLAFSV